VIQEKRLSYYYGRENKSLVRIVGSASTVCTELNACSRTSVGMGDACRQGWMKHRSRGERAGGELFLGCFQVSSAIANVVSRLPDDGSVKSADCTRRRLQRHEHWASPAAILIIILPMVVRLNQGGNAAAMPRTASYPHQTTPAAHSILFPTSAIANLS
jgi:hypothetical protein